MSFTLDPLPFAENALEPCISKETVSYHYGKHHQGYVTKLNAYFKAQNLAAVPLESLLTKSQPPAVFNNAAQIWNHTFYCIHEANIREFLVCSKHFQSTCRVGGTFEEGFRKRRRFQDQV